MSSDDPPGWPESTSGRVVIGHDAGFDFTDRLRLWEVRRFCQVKPSLATYARSSGARIEIPSESDDGDYSLTAILQCALAQVEADVAFVSLLDDERQYFISGATRSSTGFTANAPIESTRWYGCDSTIHSSALCHRTLQVGTGGIYEELDMSEQQYTRSLPIVTGEVARFRRYIGVPIITNEGYTIGTLFMVSEKASEVGLSVPQRDYLHDITRQVMKQLEQAVQVLEWRRMTRFNKAVASLAHTSEIPKPLEGHDDAERPLVQRIDSGETDFLIRHMYERAVEVFLDSYELDAAFVQEIPLHSHHLNAEEKQSTNSGPAHFARAQADSASSLPSLSH
ncbi:hypothetical protein LTR86_001023 [Recurvomyces mirabilis]|nr:hypothetical protein LTR86_001023 [Recurvomyces mirabilis]